MRPLFFEVRALGSERLGELLHDLRDQAVGLLDRARGLVDEAGLDVLPSRSERLGCIDRKERSGSLFLGLAWPCGLVRGRRRGLGLGLEALLRRGYRLCSR